MAERVSIRPLRTICRRITRSIWRKPHIKQPVSLVVPTSIGGNRMTNQSTIDKLIEMRFTAMADAFRDQLNNPKMNDLTFEDRMGILVDIEYNRRKKNRLDRLIKGAGFDQPEAEISDIDYTSGRKLNKELIRRLATCEYISEYRNIFITGATGSGKTYMACAFGMEACKQYYKTKYVRLPDLLINLRMARDEGVSVGLKSPFRNLHLQKT